MAIGADLKLPAGLSNSPGAGGPGAGLSEEFVVTNVTRSFKSTGADLKVPFAGELSDSPGAGGPGAGRSAALLGK